MSDLDLARVTTYLPSPSVIQDHKLDCCRSAVAWLHAVDMSLAYADSRWHAPTWLRTRFQWGPIRWPISWCHIPRMKVLDCGVLAAAAVRLYELRGQRAAPVQLALRYPSHAAVQWAGMWDRRGEDPRWVSHNLCYHEACGVFDGDRMELWDPTENRWLDAPQSPRENFAAVVALKVARGHGCGEPSVQWNGLVLRPSAWHSVTFGPDGRPIARPV